MTRVFKFGSAVACTLAIAAACGKQPASPSSPSAMASATGTSDAVTGANLKATAPTPVSPINGQKPEAFELTLVANNATTSFTTGIPLSYRFEIYRGSTREYESPLVAAGSGTTSYTLPSDAPIEGDQPYTWQVRAEYQGNVGPWSSLASFIAPTTSGYLKGAELYDPLINGKTVGTIVGPVTFIPGVGVRLDTFLSHIVYQLPEPLEDGELSALVTNVATNTEGGKTKIFSMAEGYSDLTTNPRRMTVEKRGDAPTGGIAWRFLTNRGDGVDTVGAERVVREFDPAQTYFWEADWRDGFFRLRINRGGVAGQNIYDFGKPYEGFYRPEPHVVYLGGGPARGGPESQTVPGMVIRQVWVSQRPRPAFANK